ncbi:hypothetical protein EYR38_009926 [Pleurotus pulmonarius]|nr:hypothetical protein EYR38_009926 [Pleurotus pulmonarius]
MPPKAAQVAKTAQKTQTVGSSPTKATRKAVLQKAPAKRDVFLDDSFSKPTPKRAVSKKTAATTRVSRSKGKTRAEGTSNSATTFVVISDDDLGVSGKHGDSENTSDKFRSMEIDERDINDGKSSHTVDENSIKSASKKTATKKTVGGTTKSTSASSKTRLGRKRPTRVVVVSDDDMEVDGGIEESEDVKLEESEDVKIEESEDVKIEESEDVKIEESDGDDADEVVNVKTEELDILAFDDADRGVESDEMAGLTDDEEQFELIDAASVGTDRGSQYNDDEDNDGGTVGGTPIPHLVDDDADEAGEFSGSERTDQRGGEGDDVGPEVGDDDLYEGDDLYDHIQEHELTSCRIEVAEAVLPVTKAPVSDHMYSGGFNIDVNKLADIQLASIAPLIDRGLLSCRKRVVVNYLCFDCLSLSFSFLLRDLVVSARFDNDEEGRNAIVAGVYTELQACRDVLQVTAALDFKNEGVFVNPSRADPGLVKRIDYTFNHVKGDRVVMRNGPAASNGPAVFVSVIVVEDVKLREAVGLSGGNSERTQKKVTGCLFGGESELRDGFFGAVLNYGDVYVNREAGANMFTSKMSPASTSSTPSPVKRSRFSESAGSNAVAKPKSKATTSSYTRWPVSLSHDSPVPVFDFTAGDRIFDFSAEAWSRLHQCPQYELRFGDDELGHDGVVALVGYSVNSYQSQDGDWVLNQNVLFLAILARAGGQSMPLIDRDGLQMIREYASNGGDLTVHPSAALNAIAFERSQAAKAAQQSSSRSKPAKVVQQASSNSGRASSSKVNHASLSKVGKPSPSKAGHASSSNAGQALSSKADGISPSKAGQVSPSKASQASPSKAGQASASKAGQASPSKAGQASASKAGQASPSKAGQVSPSKASPSKKVPKRSS